MDQKQPSGWAMPSAEYRKVMAGVEVLLRDIYAKGIISEVELSQVFAHSGFLFRTHSG